jgi:hypothetical protein
MPRGMSWRRLSMTAVQRILCQRGRTVAGSRHHARCASRPARASPACVRPAASCCTTGAPARHFADGARRQPTLVAAHRYAACGGARFGPSAVDRARRVLHARVHAVERNGGPAGNARTGDERRYAGVRRRVSGERAERSRAASRARRAAVAWRCAMAVDPTRAASTGPRCRVRERSRDEAAAGASGRRGGNCGAFRADRRREERPPTASLFAVR